MLQEPIPWNVVTLRQKPVKWNVKPSHVTRRAGRCFDERALQVCRGEIRLAFLLVCQARRRFDAEEDPVSMV